MRILFFGDVMGRSGRDAVVKYLPELKEKLKADVAIVNGENAAHGLGITEKMCREFYDAGVDCITTGDHIWDKREIVSYIVQDPRLIRPLNYPPGTPGNGCYEFTVFGGQKILIVNALGRVFIDPVDDPFSALAGVLETYKMGRNIDAIFLDFHGEATSEKMAMGHFLDGKISAVVGSHTHVPTADAQVLPGGTALQCDAGMCGDYNSVIGADKDVPLYRFTRKMPHMDRRTPAKGDGTVCGTLVETDDNTGLAKNIAPVIAGPHLKNTLPDF